MPRFPPGLDLLELGIQGGVAEFGAHFGLGLPLAQQAARALGGSLAVQSQTGGTFKVVFRLPIEASGAMDG